MNLVQETAETPCDQQASVKSETETKSETEAKARGKGTALCTSRNDGPCG